MDDLHAQLAATFLEEATELLASAEEAFLQLEESHNDPAIIEKIFRLAHNLKGSARAVGFIEMGEFTHELESFLLKIKNKELSLGRETIDLLLKCNDSLQGMVNTLKSGGVERKEEELCQQLKDFAVGYNLLENEIPSASSFNESEEGQQQNFVELELKNATSIKESPAFSNQQGLHIFEEISRNEISSVDANEIVYESIEKPKLIEENFSEKNEILSNKQHLQSSSQNESIRISLLRLEKLVSNIGELVILQTVLNQQKHQIASQFLQKNITQLSKITKDIQDISMGLRMVPLKQTFQKMQRIVRDTAKSLGKDIHLVISGEETELDKTVVDRLGDPLVHLIRNAADHGIESPEERLTAGKSAQGQIVLSASHRGGKIIIEVRDDGRGIDAKKLRSKAMEKGIVKTDQAITDQEAINFIFHPGFSTKTEVTDISGRGVGLDVVKTNIEKILQGEIQLETSLGKGCCFRIILPLTLAIIDGMVVRCQRERYVVPLTHVYESVKPKLSDVHTMTGLGEVLNLREENLIMYKLGDLLGLKGKINASSEETALVIRTGEQPFAVQVDEIIARQQVVIKKLGDEIGAIQGISGGAILGDGCAALILDLHELVNRRLNKKPIRA